MSKYLIKKLLLIIKQILDFLKTGVRGENIGNKKILFKK
ncbi:hypothetical protein F896_01471 [Acinetobacter genomosp. 15BJ]|uniref:Uncharacterized protein n=2 Tax=Acinetobacter genomosp. 15BJ TaxID=106651 RepID=R9B3D2_9GAMM|nr:hypothetical protein F896_01471 [Acinetobacter genomosp. 15BJ]